MRGPIDDGSLARTAFRAGPYGRVAAMGAATAALALLAEAFLRVPCWAVFPIVALVAFPIWRYQADRSLFRRRAMLSAIARDDSRLRRWFWAGHAALALQAALSLALAAALLAFAGQAQPAHWAILAADVLLLSLAYRPILRRLAPEVNEARVALVTRLWPLAVGNLVVLAVAFVAVDFLLVGAPDTRGLPWHQVAERSFAAASAGASCALAGWSAGALAAADGLAWHAAMVLVPALPSLPLKLAAWTAVLAITGFSGYLFTRLLLGALAIADAPPVAGDDPRAATTRTRAFVVTIALLALAHLYLTVRLADFDPAPLAQDGQRLLELANPCRAAAAPRQKALAADLRADVEAARLAARDDSAGRIDRELAAVFASLEEGVDGYLDWFFTLRGEYTRLGAVALGRLGATMEARLQEHLFERTQLVERLGEADARLLDASAAAMALAAERIGTRADVAIRAQPCLPDRIEPSTRALLQRDAARASFAVSGGTAAGLAAARIAARGVASRAAARAAAGTTGKVAGRAGAKAAASSSGFNAAAICAPFGPAALACGAAAAVATWFTVDVLLLKGDEFVNRDRMKAELMDTLGELRESTAEAMKAQHAAAIDGHARVIDERVGAMFVPRRDGL
jgi:hypothetical protein